MCGGLEPYCHSATYLAAGRRIFHPAGLSPLFTSLVVKSGAGDSARDCWDCHTPPAREPPPRNRPGEGGPALVVFELSDPISRQRDSEA
eukprot:754789-Hanusia_phi.AAC.3